MLDMKRFYTSIEFNFRDEDGNPVDMPANENTSRSGTGCDYAGYDYDYWHADGHHMEGVCFDIARDIECYLTKYPDEETFGLMDRIHISCDIEADTTVEKRNLQIWNANDGCYAVVDANFPPHHDSFLVVGFNTVKEAMLNYPSAIQQDKMFDWHKHADVQGHDPFDEKEDEKPKVDNNPHSLRIGKTYMFKHLPSNGKWIKGKITRITAHGYPWMETEGSSGIAVFDQFEVKEIDHTAMYVGKDKTELKEIRDIFENLEDAVMLRCEIIAAMVYKLALSDEGTLQEGSEEYDAFNKAHATIEEHGIAAFLDDSYDDDLVIDHCKIEKTLSERYSGSHI
jgi:hypothetical protein